MYSPKEDRSQIKIKNKHYNIMTNVASSKKQGHLLTLTLDRIYIYMLVSLAISYIFFADKDTFV